MPEKLLWSKVRLDSRPELHSSLITFSVPVRYIILRRMYEVFSLDSRYRQEHDNPSPPPSRTSSPPQRGPSSRLEEGFSTGLLEPKRQGPEFLRVGERTFRERVPYPSEQSKTTMNSVKEPRSLTKENYYTEST